MGWYMMALVDVLDFIPATHPRRKELITILNRLSTAIVKFQDAKTGVWWQVTDKANKEKNYLESSGTVSTISYRQLRAQVWAVFHTVMVRMSIM